MPRKAVPGQVIVVSAKRIKRAKVAVGGKRAKVVSRKARRLEVVVPALHPGLKRVVGRVGKRRLSGRLRVQRGLPARVKPVLEPLLAASAPIGPAGGTVIARGSNGTTYQLTVPPGALGAPTSITLTPVARFDGMAVFDPEIPAVQFAPDGLRFATPASLRITPKKPISNAVSVTYEGSGRSLEVGPAQRDGGSLVVEIEHFSGAGATPMTEAQFRTYLARLSHAQMTPGLAGQFYRLLKPFGLAWCANDPTCALVDSRAQQYLETLGNPTPCDALTDGAFVWQFAAEIRTILNLETARQDLNLPAQPSLADCRARLTQGMEHLVDDTARTDPLGISGACTSIPADLDGDGKVREVECAIYVAREAKDQGFAGIEKIALEAATAGLQKVLGEADALCTAHKWKEGQDLLKTGGPIAVARDLLALQFQDALDKCKPTVTVSPAGPSVEVGKTQDFTATSNDPEDTSFTWTADKGTIDASTGHFTAPGKPGPVTVTATSTTHSDHTGATIVTVTCPSDQAEDQGECKPVTITIDPTSTSLSPNGTKQFSATVTGPSDTSVVWSANGGSITQAGLYTAPATPGSYTVTAASHAFPAKTATAQVAVGAGTVTVTNHFGRVLASAYAHAYRNSPGGGENVTNTDNKPADGTPYSGPLVGTWSGSENALAEATVPATGTREAYVKGLSESAGSGGVSIDGGGQLHTSDSFTGHAHAEVDVDQSDYAIETQGTASPYMTEVVQFTVADGSVHASCNLSPTTGPGTVPQGGGGTAASSLTLRHTSSAVVINLSSAGSLSGSGTLTAGNYTLTVDLSSTANATAGQPFSGFYTLDPVTVDYNTTGSAACDTSP